VFLQGQTADGSRGGRRPVPSFAVLIAAYQASETIAEALDSVFAQTMRPAEIIVCDDGSTDDLKRSVAPYLDAITFLSQTNEGEAAAKNACACAASADFIVFLDADDVFMPDRLRALGDLASSRPELELLTTDAYLEVNGQCVRRCYGDDFTFEVLDQRTAILDRNFIFGLAAVKRDRFVAAGGFDTSLRYATDWDLWCRLILDGVHAGLVDRPLARYRLRPESLSAQRARLLAGRCAVLEKAASRDDLSAAERATVENALQREQREAQLAELREALESNGPNVRRLALRIARAPWARPATRARAALAAVAPKAAGWALDRRMQRDGVPGQAGVVFRRP